jgi:lipopolysaccharide export system permease protein
MGIALGFTYIFFDKISITYAINGSLDPLIAVWLPNIIFAIVGIFLVRKTQM